MWKKPIKQSISLSSALSPLLSLYGVPGRNRVCVFFSPDGVVLLVGPSGVATRCGWIYSQGFYFPPTTGSACARRGPRAPRRATPTASCARRGTTSPRRAGNRAWRVRATRTPSLVPRAAQRAPGARTTCRRGWARVRAPPAAPRRTARVGCAAPGPTKRRGGARRALPVRTASHQTDWVPSWSISASQQSCLHWMELFRTALADIWEIQIVNGSLPPEPSNREGPGC